MPVTERGVLDALPRLLGVTPTGQLLRFPSEEDPVIGPVVEVIGTGRAVLHGRSTAVGERSADDRRKALAQLARVLSREPVDGRLAGDANRLAWSRPEPSPALVRPSGPLRPA